MDQGINQTLKVKFKKKELKFVLKQMIKSEKSVWNFERNLRFECY